MMALKDALSGVACARLEVLQAYAGSHYISSDIRYYRSSNRLVPHIGA